MKEELTFTEETYMVMKEEPFSYADEAREEMGDLKVEQKSENCGNKCSSDVHQAMQKEKSVEDERPKVESTMNHFVCENMHIRVHTKKKPYICETCNKAVSQKCHLVKHIRVHTKEKPFICDICNYVFSVKCSLVTHMRVHTKEKPFICDVCNRAFSEKGVLVVNIRVHTKEKPHL
nr:zinc finger protein 630-like [Penaeus vannamei]